MSFVSTYNSVSVRGWSTNQSGYYPVTTLQIANTSEFGFAIDCSLSNYAIIGAPASQSVYFYAKNNNNIFVNVGSNTGNVGTGFIVATSGNAEYSLVGSLKSFSANLPGDAYVFERSGNTFNRTRLVNPNQANRDSFGQGLTISNNGSYCAITASRQSNIYCYERSGNIWTYHSVLSNTGGSQTGLPYVSMNEDGTKLINGNPTNLDVGKVYVFSRSNTTWTLNQTLISSDSTINDSFGFVVKFTPSANTILVCATGADFNNLTDAGAAYIFNYNTDTNLYEQTHRITSPEPTANSFFGSTGDITDDGNIVVIGDNFTNGTTRGRFYIFEKNILNNYILTNIFDGPDGNNTFFSQGLAITGNGNSILSAAYNANTGSGTGKVYQFNK